MIRIISIVCTRAKALHAAYNTRASYSHLLHPTLVPHHSLHVSPARREIQKKTCKSDRKSQEYQKTKNPSPHTHTLVYAINLFDRPLLFACPACAHWRSIVILRSGYHVAKHFQKNPAQKDLAERLPPCSSTTYTRTQTRAEFFLLIKFTHHHKRAHPIPPALHIPLFPGGSARIFVWKKTTNYGLLITSWLGIRIFPLPVGVVLPRSSWIGWFPCGAISRWRKKKTDTGFLKPSL